jgi:hypothetical protein
MGYDTDFDGYMVITPPLNAEQAAYINKFSATRRVKRDPAKASQIPDPLREAVGLPIGEEGGYCVKFGPDEAMGSIYAQDDTMPHGRKSVLDNNNPPADQPGLWCQWVITEDGSKLQWDYCEKFYEPYLWLIYIQEHFLTPWGSKLNGEIDWNGEEPRDMGTMYAEDGKIEAVLSTIHNPGPSWGKKT